MEQADDSTVNPLLDQLDLEFADERAIYRDELAQRDAELEREHFELLHDYEKPDSGFAYDYVQHTAPKPTLPSATVSGGAKQAQSYKFKKASDVREEQVPWMWNQRIPFGALTILDGDPGVGKTTIVLDLMARLSTGRPMPFDKEPLDVSTSLVVSVEDSVAYTIVPRLRAAGADLELVNILIDFPLFPSGLEKLKGTIAETKAKLVMVDPGLAMFDSEINPHSDAETRKVVGGLAALAAHSESAIIFVRHLTKAQRSDAMYRGGGSIAIAATARSGLLAKFPRKQSEHPVLASYKNSLGLKPATVTYKIVGDAGGISHIEWLEEIGMSADEALEGDLPQQHGSGGAQRSEPVKESLQTALLRALQSAGQASASELRESVGGRREAVQKALDELVTKACIEVEEEKGKGRPKRVYRPRNPLDDEQPPEGPQERFD